MNAINNVSVKETIRDLIHKYEEATSIHPNLIVLHPLDKRELVKELTLAEYYPNPAGVITFCGCRLVTSTFLLEIIVAYEIPK